MTPIPETLLAIDFETSGPDPASAEVLEIGLVLWHVEAATPVFQFGGLVRPPAGRWDWSVPVDERGRPLSPGLSRDLIGYFGCDFHYAESVLWYASERAGALVAHNADFERAILARDFAKYLPDGLPWIDTMVDLPFPESTRSRRLTHLATDHGIPVRGAHRALTDCLLSLELLACYDIGEVCEIAASSVIELVAQVDFARRELAKEAGFHWDPARRLWLLRGKAALLERRIGDLSFNVERREVAP